MDDSEISENSSDIALPKSPNGDSSVVLRHGRVVYLGKKRRRSSRSNRKSKSTISYWINQANLWTKRYQQRQNDREKVFIARGQERQNKILRQLDIQQQQEKLLQQQEKLLQLLQEQQQERELPDYCQCE